MFKAILGNMTKFRAFSYFILLVVISVLNAVVPDSKQDLVQCFYLLVGLCFWFECCSPVDETKVRNNKRK
jgi:hypothetical protein